MKNAITYTVLIIFLALTAACSRKNDAAACRLTGTLEEQYHGATVTMIAHVTGANGATTYQWSQGPSLTNTYAVNTSGIYSVTAVDSRGCQSLVLTDTIDLNIVGTWSSRTERRQVYLGATAAGDTIVQLSGQSYVFGANGNYTYNEATGHYESGTYSRNDTSVEFSTSFSGFGISYRVPILRLSAHTLILSREYVRPPDSTISLTDTYAR